MKPHPPTGLRARIIALYALLFAGNVAAWGWALMAFHPYPVLLGMAVLAYSFGLRHAFDFDHIAAIDNVTRKLMQDGQQPAGTGWFFALGHSTIVVLASVGIAAAAGATGGRARFAALQNWGGLVGTLVSAVFLLAIALANAVSLAGIWRALCQRRQAGPPPAPPVLLADNGMLTRLLRPVFGLVRRSWHMYPLGVLFGLGFDTATEIGLLGISAAGAARGMPIWSILVFPALFTAGMTLMDTTDGVLMLGAYGSALANPVRRLRYNLAMTALSVLVAVAVGGIEALGLLADRLGLKGRFWDAISALNDNAGTLGCLIVALFVVVWLGSAVIGRTGLATEAG